MAIFDNLYIMAKQEIQNDYSVHAQSFFFFLLHNWKLWLVFVAIVGSFFYMGKSLYEENYFGEEIAGVIQRDVTIKQTRSTPNTSVLVINPLDKTPFRLYEVDLGLNCKVKNDIEGQTFPMNVELHKRNYNNTYYLKFPDIQKHVCVPHILAKEEFPEKPEEAVIEETKEIKFEVSKTEVNNPDSIEIKKE